MLVKLLSSLSVGFLSGVFIHSLVHPETPHLSLALIAFALAFALRFLLRKKSYLVIIVCFCIGFGFGILRYAQNLNPHEASILDIFADEGTSIMVHGTIVSDPLDKTSYVEFVLDADHLVIADTTLPIRTRILVRADLSLDYEYGQSVVVLGAVRKPTAFETDTERIFDYRAYLAKDDIYYTMSYASGVVTDEGGQSLVRRLYHLKHVFLNNIYRFVPEPEAGLLAGILFGQEAALTQEYDDKFRIVGLTHIVVLSGYNVSVVILLFMRLFAFLPRLPRAGLAVLSIFAFALLVGAGPTVIRASIMAIFIVLAELLHRRYHIERALFVAGLFMVLWNPKILFFDIGFQLSFLATYGLIVLSPWFEQKLKKLPKMLLIRESAVATLSAQTIVLPLLVYKIGEFSLISPVVNVLVLFAVPFSMGVGFLTALVGLAFPMLATPFALITSWSLSYQLLIVDIFSVLPLASISFPPFHWTFMLLLYGLLFLFIRNISAHKVS